MVENLNLFFGVTGNKVHPICVNNVPARLYLVELYPVQRVITTKVVGCNSTATGLMPCPPNARDAGVYLRVSRTREMICLVRALKGL